MAKVSVLMPVRDMATTLPSCLKSLQWQTYRDWELVAVDDGSSDQTVALLDSYARTDPRIHWCSSEGRGLVAALNSGVPRCKGRWLARMDGDDICHPRRLEIQMSRVDDNTVVGCRVGVFPRRTLSSGLRRYEGWLNRNLKHDDIERSLFVESPMVHPSVVFSRDLLERAGGYRDMGWAEDYDLWMRIWLCGGRFEKVAQTLFWWRDSQHRLTRTHRAYAQEQLRRLKVHFLKRSFLKTGRPVCVWGAGPNGKKLARELGEQGYPIAAFCDLHPGRIGQTIANAPVYSPESLPDDPSLLHLGSVGQSGGRNSVKSMLTARGLAEMQDFVCMA